MTKELRTADEVVEALGGTGAVARMTRRVDSAVSNWRKAGRFPSRLYLVFSRELEQRGIRARRDLWDFDP